MNIVSTLARDKHERLGWMMAGGILSAILAVWLVGLAVHNNRDEVSPARTAAMDLIRADATHPMAMRTISFAEQGRDLVARDADDGTAIKHLGFERDGFVVSIVRSLDRERRRIGVPTGQPYRLTRWNNGQVLFEDPTTGGQIELTAFGSTNVGAFAQLLSAKAETARR